MTFRGAGCWIFLFLPLEGTVLVLNQIQAVASCLKKSGTVFPQMSKHYFNLWLLNTGWLLLKKTFDKELHHVPTVSLVFPHLPTRLPAVSP